MNTVSIYVFLHPLQKLSSKEKFRPSWLGIDRLCVNVIKIFLCLKKPTRRTKTGQKTERERKSVR